MLLLFKYKHLEPIILKNLKGHQRRNSKTALMYTIAISFLIFTGSAFSLQTKAIGDTIKNIIGSDLKVHLIDDYTGLDEAGMRGYL